MRRSLGLVESERQGREVLTAVAFWEEMEGGHVSCIWKDKQIVGAEAGKGERGDGGEEEEVVENPVGVGVVESPSVFSVSLLDRKGVRGGTSSTSTSE